eukprot:TRINITY_DN8506_c0_g1_i1.p1 TRINITY_DN8506_c0_g1~~TRINITY_DN8506_c0_g1_i1.p1  ORF type:complete len:122 (-),score=22.52 TRINITY_DN8506_c0_g1_i1:46-411(-)
MDLISTYNTIIQGTNKSWVIFSHGTVVIFNDPSENDRERAIDLLRTYGPVHVGTPAGDFNVIELNDEIGWAVTCHHNDILTFVGKDEVENPNDFTVGLYGRSKRDLDGHELSVIHVGRRES